MHRVNPPTPESEAVLEAFLSHPSNPDGTLSLGELRGFLFAMAAAPELVKPSDWIPCIFGEREPEFETMDQAQQVMGALMSLYNETNDVVRAKGTLPLKGCEFRDDLLANLEPDAPVSQWSRGFMTGHLWLEQSWNSYVPDSLDDELGAILLTLSFFSSRATAERFIKESARPDTPLETFAEQLRDVFDDAWMQYVKLGNAISQAVSTMKQLRVGRNQPCPCGSGKKYKRCCGTKPH